MTIPDVDKKTPEDIADFMAARAAKLKKNQGNILTVALNSYGKYFSSNYRSGFQETNWPCSTSSNIVKLSCYI